MQPFRQSVKSQKVNNKNNSPLLGSGEFLVIGLYGLNLDGVSIAGEAVDGTAGHDNIVAGL